MRNVFLGGVAVVALATLTTAGADRASAQSTGAGTSDARTIENLEKENAAMRARIRRLELEKDNVALRARLDQLQPQRQPTQRPTAAPAMAEARAEPVTLSPGLVDYANEMEFKAPPLVLPPLYSWTGFYAGGQRRLQRRQRSGVVEFQSPRPPIHP
jgi:hypothetical protein